MVIPEELKYSKDHEWVRVEGEFAVTGITDYAQGELSDIVYVELPKLGKEVKQGDVFGTIEAVKAVADLYAAVSGEVVKVNDKLAKAPELVNKDPYGDGWMVKLTSKDPSELDSLLTAEQYQKLIGK